MEPIRICCRENTDDNAMVSLVSEDVLIQTAMPWSIVLKWYKQYQHWIRRIHSLEQMDDGERKCDMVAPSLDCVGPTRRKRQLDAMEPWHTFSTPFLYPKHILHGLFQWIQQRYTSVVLSASNKVVAVVVDWSWGEELQTGAHWPTTEYKLVLRFVQTKEQQQQVEKWAKSKLSGTQTAAASATRIESHQQQPFSACLDLPLAQETNFSDEIQKLQLRMHLIQGGSWIGRIGLCFAWMTIPFQTASQSDLDLFFKTNTLWVTRENGYLMLVTIDTEALSNIDTDWMLFEEGGGKNGADANALPSSVYLAGNSDFCLQWSVKDVTVPYSKGVFIWLESQVKSCWVPLSDIRETASMHSWRLVEEISVWNLMYDVCTISERKAISKNEWQMSSFLKGMVFQFCPS